MHRPGDGHVHAHPLGQLQHALGRRDALDDALEARGGLGERLAFPDGLSERAVSPDGADTGGHQVAHARQPGERLVSPPHRLGQPGNLRQAACDQGGLGVVAGRQAVQNPRRNRDDVLRRAGDLDAHGVEVGVDAEVRSADAALNAEGEVRLGGRHGHAGGLAAGDLRRDGRPGQHGQGARRVRRVVQHVAKDLRGAQERLILDALGHRADRHRRRAERLQPPPHAPDELRRHGGDGPVRPGQRPLVVGADLDALAQRHPRQEAAVLASLGQLPGLVGKGRPEPDRTAVLRQQDGTECAHGPIADDRHAIFRPFEIRHDLHGTADQRRCPRGQTPQKKSDARRRETLHRS